MKFQGSFTTAESTTLTFMGLPLTVQRSIIYNWSYKTFTYYKIIFLIICPGATHAPLGVKLKPQVYSMILPNLIQIGQHLGEQCMKTCFRPIIVDGHANGCGMDVNKLF